MGGPRPRVRNVVQRRIRAAGRSLQHDLQRDTGRQGLHEKFERNVRRQIHHHHDVLLCASASPLKISRCRRACTHSTASICTCLPTTQCKIALVQCGSTTISATNTACGPITLVCHPFRGPCHLPTWHHPSVGSKIWHVPFSLCRSRPPACQFPEQLLLQGHCAGAGLWPAQCIVPEQATGLPISGSAAGVGACPPRRGAARAGATPQLTSCS